MSEKYRHSVFLKHEKCSGCVNCIKQCPTEAIRVRQGKAMISEERCIDCGECIRACPNLAKAVVTDGLSAIERFPYKVALVPPSFYGQFKKSTTICHVHAALRHLGFDHIMDVAFAAEVVSEKIKEILHKKNNDAPLISSACPAVVRLIQVKFPGLISQLIPLESPMELAGRLAKIYAARETGLAPEQIGTFFLTPCSAKASAVKNLLHQTDCSVDGVISVAEIFPKIRGLNNPDIDFKFMVAPGVRGIKWSMAGGEQAAVQAANYLTVDGIRNVQKLLDEVDMNRLQGIDFLELQACDGGCVGGFLNIQSRFQARVQLRWLMKEQGSVSAQLERATPFSAEELEVKAQIVVPESISAGAFAPGLEEAIKIMKQYDLVLEQLPGLDCGSCGSPTCKALAEDVALNKALEIDCIFKLREKIMLLADEVLVLSKILPPSLNRAAKDKAKESD
ncbi:MAG: 4Fe-4S binding protein [Dethiobacter sp.]|jgi:iron only hydrogenase large subunit-like protein|nr:4Fe-4S binding protein [Dethiobacter sp.]MBS3900973.1 4Fe-4S binding protein [Dethiobacter sp.]